MKQYVKIILAAFVGLLLVNVCSAQDSIPVSPEATLTADSLVQWLTPILVPILLAGVKRFLPRIPSGFLPFIAPALGIIMELINRLATGHVSNLFVAAGLGLLGVAVREIKEAVKPAPNGGWPVNPSIS